MVDESQGEIDGGPRRTQLGDIAAETGFSVPTISKVLNGRPGISEHTRSLVEQALRKHGYQRRNRLGMQSRLIEVVFQDFNNLWALEVMRGVIREAKKHDISVITTESGDRNHPDSQWLDSIIQRKPLGAILIFSDLSQQERARLQSQGIAYVLFDPSGDPAQTSFSVQADNWAGGVLATRHLIALGHRRIGTITGPMEMMCTRARLDGYSTALAEAGIAVDPALITEGDYTTQGGYAAAMELLSDPHAPTALFAGNDLQAMGTYEAARQLGLRIPEDLSVVGFDDVQAAAYLGPPLTTVMQPLQDMAAAATRMIIGISRGEDCERHLILPTKLIVRSSTCRLITTP